MNPAVLVSLGTLAAATPARAAEPAHSKIYYLSVGVDAYADPAHTPKLAGAKAKYYPSPKGLETSAVLVANTLEQWEATAGLILVSKPGRYVTRRDVLDRIDRVIRLARDDPSAFIVLYFAGHGLSEGMAFNHFSVPGDYVGPADVGDTEWMAKHTIFAGDAVDALKASGKRFMVLFDNCYPADVVSWKSQLLSVENQRNLTDATNALRFMNEFRLPNPVLFSTQPGRSVSQVSSPVPGLKAAVGPLARRLYLAQQALKSSEGILLKDIVAILARAGFDEESGPAFTRHRPLSGQVKFRFREIENLAGKIEQGSAQHANAASLRVSAAATPPPATPLPASRLSCKLRVTGTKDDFVTGGRPIQLQERASVELYDDGGSLSVGFTDGDLEVVAPEGETLGRRAFPRAERAHMGNASKPGLSFGWDGSGCNESTGRFDILRWSKTKDGLRALDLSFEQVCDGEGSLRGRLVCGT